MNRNDAITQLRSRAKPWDIVVIGGGATGLGAAVDAASRGYEVVLLERNDFASGTSSRSTKLVHGGVRYLRQGNVSLVREALRERDRLRRNAPEIVHELACVVPSYSRWDSAQYWAGLKLYDLLAGSSGIRRSRHLSRHETLELLPEVQSQGLRGGTLYYDCQFDDARLAIALAQTAAQRGAVVINYFPVTGLLKTSSGALRGVQAFDCETDETFEIEARVVINATGPFSDAVRRLDDPAADSALTLSRGTHVVLDRSLLSGNTAMLVPRTSDGRVIFMIPWQGVVLVGTTDVLVNHAEFEPAPSDTEIEYLLETANQYLDRSATRSDIRSVFAGLRPLVRSNRSGRTARISREHSIIIDSESKLLSIVGGKWTTYRAMAEDLIDKAIVVGGLSRRNCVTAELPLHVSDSSRPGALSSSDSSLGYPVCDGVSLSETEVIRSCREEMARTVEDVLSRRYRLLFVDARKAAIAAPRVAEIMAAELGRNAHWIRKQVDAFAEIVQCSIPAT